MAHADPWPGSLESNRLGRSHLRHQRGLERSAVRFPVSARRPDRSPHGSREAPVQGLLSRQTERKGPLGESRCRDGAASRSSSTQQLCLRHARHRRQACDRLLRLRGPLRVRPGRQPALETGRRRARPGRLRRARLQMGQRQLSDPLQGSCHCAVRSAKRVVPRLVRRCHGQAGVAYRT